MTAIPARFTGGPLDGQYRVLEYRINSYYIPVLDYINIQPFTSSEFSGDTLIDSVKVGRYYRDYRPPINGLYEYVWRGYDR